MRLRKVLTKYRMSGASHTGLTIQNLGYLGLSKLQAVTFTGSKHTWQKVSANSFLFRQSSGPKLPFTPTDFKELPSYQQGSRNLSYLLIALWPRTRGRLDFFPLGNR